MNSVEEQVLAYESIRVNELDIESKVRLMQPVEHCKASFYELGFRRKQKKKFEQLAKLFGIRVDRIDCTMRINDLWANDVFTQYLQGVKMTNHKRSLMNIIKNQRIFKKQPRMPPSHSINIDSTRLSSHFAPETRTKSPMNKKKLQQFRTKLSEIILTAKQNKKSFFNQL